LSERGHLLPISIPRIREELWRLLREGNAALRLPVLALVRFYSGQAPLRAAALTYTTLLAIVPIMAFGFAILRGLGFDQGIYEYILAQLGPVFNTDIREKLFAFIAKVNFKTLGATGLGVFLVSIILTLNTVERSLNVMFGVRKARPLVRKFTDYFSLIFFTPLLLAIIVSSTTLFKIRGFIASLGSYWFLTTGAELLLKLVPLVGSIFLVTLMLIVLPNRPVRLIPSLAGGTVGGVLMFILQWVYVSVQVGFAGKMAIYGALAQLPILMVWIYLGWCILFYAAGLAALVEGLPARAGVGEALQAEGSGWEAALLVMSALARRAATREPPWTLGQLEKKLDYPAEILNTVVYRLKKSGLVAETEEEGHLIPARSTAAIAAVEIFEAIEDEPSPVKDPEFAGASELLRRMNQGRRAALEGITLEELLAGKGADGVESAAGAQDALPAA